MNVVSADSLPTGGAVPAVLTRWTTDVQRTLRSQRLATSSLLGRMAGYHLGWLDADGSPASASGKHLRSNLCCWAAQACGGSVEAALPTASAIELIHNFTLVHDDVQDGDDMRRGRPTVWAVWGVPQAINAGDYLFALALSQLLAEPMDGSSAVAPVVLDAVLEIVEGQTTDLATECRPDTSVGVYLAMVERKTGALLGASLETGAMIGSADAPVRACLRRAGRLLGAAFQLRDDWLGIWGESSLTGKSRRGDLARRKLTYPVAAAYSAANREQRRRLLALYDHTGPREEAAIRNLLEELDVAKATEAAAMTHAEEAIETIRETGFEPGSVEEFADVALHVVDRQH